MTEQPDRDLDNRYWSNAEDELNHQLRDERRRKPKSSDQRRSAAADRGEDGCLKADFSLIEGFRGSPV